MTDHLQPTEEQRQALAQKYYGQTRPDLHWKDLREDEQRGLLDEWREQQQPSAEELARAAEVDRRMTAATTSKPADNFKQPSATAKRLFEVIRNGVGKTTQAIVPMLVHKECRDLEVRLQARLDKISVGVLKAVRSDKNYIGVLEEHIREAHVRLIALEKEVAELRRR